MSSCSKVLPSATPFTDDDVREIIRGVLLPLCSDMGPTRVANALTGVEERTVRRARDEQTTLCLDTAANLLRLDPLAFDGFLARVERRSVPMHAVCDTDALPALTGAVHKLVVAASPTSDEGAALSDRELLDSELEIRAAYDALDALLTKAAQIRSARGRA